MTRYASIDELRQACSNDVRERNAALLGPPTQPQKPVKPSKYHNTRVEWDGEWFDSRKELARWLELRLMERGGVISDLHRQVWFDLAAGIRMRLDATYIENGKLIAEDVKGMKPTREWLNKAKLFKDRYTEWELRIV